MSDKKVDQEAAVSIDIDDLNELVGGLTVASLNQTLVASSSLGSVAYNPDTCPTSPGAPVSTCMCPSAKGFDIGAIVQPQIRY